MVLDPSSGCAVASAQSGKAPVFTKRSSCIRNAVNAEIADIAGNERA
jgi:hypothetical protein